MNICWFHDSEKKSCSFLCCSSPSETHSAHTEHVSWAGDQTWSECCQVTMEPVTEGRDMKASGQCWCQVLVPVLRDIHGPADWESTHLRRVPFEVEMSLRNEIYICTHKPAALQKSPNCLLVKHNVKQQTAGRPSSPLWLLGFTANTQLYMTLNTVKYLICRFN